MISLSHSTLSHSKTDKWLIQLTRMSALLSATILILIVLFLVLESIPAVSKIGISRFFTDKSWHPLSSQFNLLPMALGTLLTSAGATLIAGPTGIASAVFCHFYAPKSISILFQRLIELLAGIPSVVFGLWGLVVIAPLIGNFGGSGQCLLTAILILGLMILPTVALTSLSALRAVPNEIIFGGAALGLNRTSIAWNVAIPAAWQGIRVGIILAISRALGETMAVLMIAGNVVQIPNSLLSPIRTLTANIALEMGYATSSHRSILFFSGLLLMMLVIVIFTFSSSTGGKKHET